MKNIILVLSLFLCSEALAQLSEGGMPYSFSQTRLKTQVKLPEYHLKKLNADNLKQEDIENPSPFRYSIFEEVYIDIKSGVSTEINEPKGTIWRQVISSENAFSIQISFKTFNIPTGAKLFIYNNDYSVVYGAFTKQNAENDQTFIVADFPGKELIIEYFEPYEAEFNGIVKIGYIGQAYKNILQFEEENAEQRSFIDVNCYEGKNWQNEKHAVCKISFRVGRSGYLCSGALINNTSNDGTPYFLTANHCIDDTTVAKTLVAFFNYEKKSCNGALNDSKTLSGSRLMTTGIKSDHTLLLLNSKPPVDFMPFYAGWDIGNYQDNENVSIHHPEGIEKKISIDNDKIATYEYSLSWNEGVSSPPLSHWLVSFDMGKTSEGSSGGPLFSKQKRIIGQLHGGSDDEEFYGKLNYSWTNNNSGFNQLKKYLDPTNTGKTVLDGYFSATNLPDAYFTSALSKVCLNSSVTIFENSAFNPTSREWTIAPSSFRYVNGTDKNSISPQVEFTSAGNYSILLNVFNANGNDTIQVKNAIIAGTKLNIDLMTSLKDTLCYYNFDSLILIGSGADTYNWNLKKQIVEPFYLSNIVGDTAILKINNSVEVNSNYQLTINLTGIHGTCKDSAEHSIQFLKVSNDNIANAIEIGLGTSESFSNLCASIEPKEPVPPTDSCTGLKTWCDEYGTGKDIVQNSVWFKFTGPPTGKVGLQSDGFDNEIAIYEADSYQDILNGKYLLLAANDDQNDTNPNPLIPGINVQPGKTYWIQVDGSGGGSEGIFTLTLTDKNITDLPVLTQTNSPLVLYPQPASDYLTIQARDLKDKPSQIKIYSLSGKLYFQENINKADGSEITINVSQFSPGIYLLKLISGDNILVSKFIKR